MQLYGCMSSQKSAPRSDKDGEACPELAGICKDDRLSLEQIIGGAGPGHDDPQLVRRRGVVRQAPAVRTVASHVLRPVTILLGLFIWGETARSPGAATVLAIPLTSLGIGYYRRYVLHHMEASAGANWPPGFPPLITVATEKTEEAVFTRKGRS